MEVSATVTEVPTEVLAPTTEVTNVGTRFAKLPIEIVEEICNFLQFHKLELFEKHCEKIKMLLQNPMYWKRRCVLDFQYNLPTPRYDLGWKSHYVFLMKKACVHCFEDTDHVNYFFGNTVCRLCERSLPQYSTLCKSAAMKQYRVKGDDLERVRYFTKRNSHNRRLPIQIYLESDVAKLAVATVVDTKSVKRRNKTINYILNNTGISPDLAELLQSMVL